MTSPVRLLLRFWFVAPLLAAFFLVWMHRSRADHVEALSKLPTEIAVDPKSPTGYAGGLRTLVVPGHNNESYQWILQTQQMVHRGEWRLRHVDYDNAPVGRPVYSPSPYRWWLAASGWLGHTLSGAPIGLAIEQAALWADPLLHLMLLAGAAGFVAWRFGRLPALLVSFAVAFVFPLAGGFVPGAPDARSLTYATLLGSLLTLTAGVFAAEKSIQSTRRWFITAGGLAGAALWLDVTTAVILGGIVAGAVASVWLNRKRNAFVLPWRAWAIAGACATLTGYVVEFAPAHLEWKSVRLSSVHPLYAIAWLGIGEWLARLPPSAARERRRRDSIALALATLAVASVPVAMWINHDRAFLTPGTFAARLTLLDDAPGADNFAKWMVQEGLSFRLLATCLPLALLPLAGWMLFRRDTSSAQRTAIVLLLVPAVIGTGFAWAELSWWPPLDYVLVVLLAAVCVGVKTDGQTGRWLIGTAIVSVLGLIALLPANSHENATRSPAELQALAERDFSHWLARRRGEEGALVLAPPNLTVSLIYHGGLRGLGSPYRENEDGFRASVRIAGAIHADEAHALARQRGLTHVVIPTWDNFLDEYSRLGGAAIEQTFLGLLHSWLPPRWLRPVAYYVPNNEAFSNEQLFIFEHTDIQDNATALGRLAEYFLDMGQIQLASQVTQALAHEYAADLGAQIAKARTELVRRDQAGFSKTVETIVAGLEQGVDDLLPWDRRVSLCLVLASANRATVAREQVERCLYEMSETDVRTLSEGTLFRFLLLCKALGLEIEDTQLRDLARSLVPEALRAQL